MPAEPHHTDVDNKENNMTAVTADVGQEKKGKGTEEVPEEPLAGLALANGWRW